jgi:hypothetical protein
VSSRPTPEISRALSSVRIREIGYEDSRSDMQAYVSFWVSESKILEKGFKAMSQSPSNFIAERSQGNFLCVKIILDMLKDKTSSKDSLDVIETIPKDISDVYNQILSKLKRARSLELVLMILKFVLYSERLLTI